MCVCGGGEIEGGLQEMEEETNKNKAGDGKEDEKTKKIRSRRRD